MHLIPAEVAPAGPAGVEALAAFFILAGLVVALGLVMLLDAFVRALFGAVASLFSHIPGIGGLTSGAIHSAERAISHALGVAISGIESHIAHTWHQAAHLVQRAVWAMEDFGNLIFSIAHRINRLITTSDVVRWFHDAMRAIRGAQHAATHDLSGAVHGLKLALTRVEHNVFPRMRALEHAIDVAIPREIKTARDLAKEAEDGVTRLWKAVRALPTVAEVGALVVAAIAALGLVGLDLLKCSKSGEINNTRGCTMWNALDDLLGLLALGIAAGEFEVLIHEAQDLTEVGITVFDDVFGLSR